MLTGNRGFGLAVATLVAGVVVAELHGGAPEPEAEPATRERLERAGERPVSTQPACDDASRLLDTYRALYHSGTHGKFRFLIVLAPDPAESGHVDYFDAVLEGVDEAAAAGSRDFWDAAEAPRRHVRDRHFLPWNGARETSASDCAARAPGIIIYRPVEDPDYEPALAALVVGETPTWGVREGQMTAALALIDAERSARSDAEAGGDSSSSLRFYRVLGPTFSGSAASLAALLEQHARNLHADGSGDELVFRIASGTATSAEAARVLQVHLPDLRFRTEYTAAVPDDAAMLRAVFDFLPDASGAPDAVADSVVLSESMTVYGESTSLYRRVETTTATPPNERNAARAPVGALTVLRFPPNLVSLRRAYGDAPAVGSTGRLQLAPSDAKAATEERRGELSEQTPITHDLALAELLRALDRRNVRNVGIVATDARDVVFLAERVKRQLPDVRLFTLGFDLRFLHPDHASVLNGMLVAHAARSAHLSSVLENPMAAGVFEAGRSLLAGTKPTPQVRVSLIGNGALYRMSSEPAGTKERRYSAVPSGFTFVYFAALGVFGLVLLVVGAPTVVAHLGAPNSPLPPTAKQSAFMRQRTAFWSELGNCDHLDLAADHAFATAALVTIALSAPLVMASTVARFDSPTLTVVLVGAALAMVLSRSWLRARRHFRQACRSALLLGVLVSLVGALSTSLGCGEPREATVNLLSGGSPLIGGLLGLGMLLVVTWCWRARLRLLDTLRFGALPGARFFESEKLPITELLGQPQKSELGELERRLLRVLRSPWLAAPFMLVLVNGLLLLSLAYVFASKPPLTFEHGFRHWVLVGFVCACIFPITTSFARIVSSSRALMRFLRCVARFPQVEALRKLPPELARRLETQLVHGGRSIGELLHPVETLKRIGARAPWQREAADEVAALLARELAYEAGAATTDQEASAKYGPAELAQRLLSKAHELEQTRDRFDAEGAALVDEYQARLLAIFVGRYVRNLRLLVPPVVCGSILAVLMTSLYFVQPQHLIASVCFVWVTGMAVGIVAVYVSLARDPVISAIGGTRAGEIQPSFGFALRLLAFALVPVTSLLAAQYPKFGYWVSSLLGAAARVAQ